MNLMRGKHPTSNIQHPTPNKRPNRNQWMFDVGCWLLDVPNYSCPVSSVCAG
jgi:hypothetical protein